MKKNLTIVNMNGRKCRKEKGIRHGMSMSGLSTLCYSLATAEIAIKTTVDSLQSSKNKDAHLESWTRGRVREDVRV